MDSYIHNRVTLESDIYAIIYSTSRNCLYREFVSRILSRCPSCMHNLMMCHNKRGLKDLYTYHDSTWPDFGLSVACNLYIYVDMASRNNGRNCSNKGETWLAWKWFFVDPGLESNLFSPTFLEPSLILFELDWKGSGAAILDSFYGY